MRPSSDRIQGKFSSPFMTKHLAMIGCMKRKRVRGEKREKENVSDSDGDGSRNERLMGRRMREIREEQDTPLIARKDGAGNFSCSQLIWNVRHSWPTLPIYLTTYLHTYLPRKKISFSLLRPICFYLGCCCNYSIDAAIRDKMWKMRIWSECFSSRLTYNFTHQ